MDRSNEPAMQELTKTVDQSGYSLYDLLNSMGYCGFKLWSQEDMEAQFAVMMREVKDDNSVSSELKQLWADKTAAQAGVHIQDCDAGLSSCTDSEWGTIQDCIFSKVRAAEAHIGNMQGR